MPPLKSHQMTSRRAISWTMGPNSGDVNRSY
jgi:hypothetical protein